MLRVTPVKSDSNSGDFVGDPSIFSFFCRQSSVGDLLYFMAEKLLN